MSTFVCLNPGAAAEAGQCFHLLCKTRVLFFIVFFFFVLLDIQDDSFPPCLNKNLEADLHKDPTQGVNHAVGAAKNLDLTCCVIHDLHHLG